MTEIIAAILTLSDKGSRGERTDESGKLLRNTLQANGISVAEYEVIPDEKEILAERLIKLSERVDLIITNGGTGLSPRDITPDVTIEVIEREIPGIAEAMRTAGMQKTPRAMLSRAVAGVRGECLIVNLPGSPKAVQEGIDTIIDVIPHAIEKIKGSGEDCAR
ncbi:MAG TPA: MogA/MoaB family molybdenum cofactor biosynthesis protein [Nitrospirae bacterium]|nr:molybdopterin adenylyltransferase [bacterium BMS3Abin08]HDO36898.1 MogA/MoaB family molybdenum cofactor biosynthesis protein [Nitrospirota bacterium]HDY70926.1 MogA/MoaB family molybdenum cofactor biosynthesis protein [Nitrospirota bacterium]